MSASESPLMRKLRELPEEKLAEVEDFVDFLRQRTLERTLTQSAAKMAEASFAAVWDNSDDAEYDQL